MVEHRAARQTQHCRLELVGYRVTDDPPNVTAFVGDVVADVWIGGVEVAGITDGGFDLGGVESDRLGQLFFAAYAAINCHAIEASLF